MSELSGIVSRLEAVTSRLEGLAVKGVSSGSSPGDGELGAYFQPSPCTFECHCRSE